MLGPIRIAGCGVEVDVTLPSGVSTIEVQNRRRKLAENLTRHEHEVFITIPTAARTVRLWVADSGALDEPIGPSPLFADETLTADYAKGRAPWGQDLRGDAAALPLHQRHLPHAEVQARERKTAGDLWVESDYVFTKRLGGPLSPNTDYHDWKRLLDDARVRDGRLHDARHTAATVLMLLGVPDRVIDQIMGWEPGTSARMRARYLHVPDAMLKDVARKIAEAIWG